MLKPETNTPLLEDLQAHALNMLKTIDSLDEDESLSMQALAIEEEIVYMAPVEFPLELGAGINVHNDADRLWIWAHLGDRRILIGADWLDVKVEDFARGVLTRLQEMQTLFDLLAALTKVAGVTNADLINLQERVRSDFGTKKIRRSTYELDQLQIEVDATNLPTILVSADLGWGSVGLICAYHLKNLDMTKVLTRIKEAVQAQLHELI